MTLLLNEREFLPEDPGTVPSLETGPTGGFQSPPLRLQRSAGPRPVVAPFISLIYASAMTTSFVATISPETLQDLLPTTSMPAACMEQWMRASASTTAPRQIQKTPREAIHELRRLSGLTWEELASLFGVSRRSVHFWGSGERMSAENERKLFRLLGVIKKIDRGVARANRLALLMPDDQGHAPLDLLKEGRYDEVASRLAPATPARRLLQPSVSPEVEKARMPLPPDVLAGALQDPVRHETGIARPVRRARRAKT